MNTQEIVSKLWKLCNVLRDDGITYHEYVTELTYILFLKMAKETNAEGRFAEGVTIEQGDNLTPEEETQNSEKKIVQAYSWDNFVSKSGLELHIYYKTILRLFGSYCTGRGGEFLKG